MSARQVSQRQVSQRQPTWRALTWLCSVVLAACASQPQAADWHVLIGSAAGQLAPAWQSTGFGGDGEITTQGSHLRLGIGNPLTGVTWPQGAPHGEYELEVIAARELGDDFFCALTFPVGNSFLTLVLGGWGGTVCGFSNLDGLDANRNPTRTLRSFALGQDYCVRVSVTDAAVTASVDGVELARTSRSGVHLDLRNEMLPCTPLGISSFATAARIARVAWRPLGESEARR